MRILCVCQGNTCRSPMARGVIEAMARAAGLALEVDSAGLAPRRAGSPPDPRALATAARRGYDLSAHRARAVAPGDFAAFDLILAMDHGNLDALRRRRPAGARAAMRLFHPAGRDIPDPWYGGLPDYEHALDLVEGASQALLAELIA